MSNENPYAAPSQPQLVPYLDGPIEDVQPAIGRVVSLQEAKDQCRVDSDITADDNRINGLIDEVTDWFVKQTGGRQLLTATFRIPVRTWWGNGWGDSFLNDDVGLCRGALKLPRPPLLRVDAIQYYDANDTLTTLGSSAYLVRTPKKQPGEIELAPNQVWPALSPLRQYPILIQFVAGYITPVTANATADTITATVMTYTAGQTVVFSASSDGTVPGGLTAGVVYYVINPTNGGLTFQVSTTSGGSAVNITSAGTGSIWTGQLPFNIRRAILLKVAEAYRDRELGVDAGDGWQAADRLAALEEWGGY